MKSTVRTDRFAGVGDYSMHTFALRNGSRSVGEDWAVVNDGESWRVLSTRLRVGLHCYLTMSQGEFVEKMGGARGDNPGTEEFGREWEREGRRKVEYGKEMRGYVP